MHIITRKRARFIFYLLTASIIISALPLFSVFADDKPPISPRPCQNKSECLLEEACVEYKANDGHKYNACQIVAPQIPAIPPFSLPSPTAATTFSDFACGVTNLVSQQLLPPLAVFAMLVVGFMFLVSGGDPGKANAAKQALFFTLAGVALLVLAPGIVALISDLLSGFSVTPLACGSTVVTNTIISAFVNLVNWFSWFVAVVSVVMGLYGGFLYMTAGTDPSRVAQGSRVLSFTIIGIAVSVIAFSIIALVRGLL